MTRFEKAKPKDASALSRASERAFHSDIHCGAPSIGGPPGYNSEAWQRQMMRIAQYYKMLRTRDSGDDQIVGGFIVFRKGTRHYELGRIFVDPDFQNQGIGAQAFDFLWEEFPLTRKWTLGTPAWNRRTRHFYKKVGFVEVGEDGRGGILLEKRIPARAPHA